MFVPCHVLPGACVRLDRGSPGGRAEDIEPNLEYELERYAREHGEQVRFNAEAKRAFLRFASGPDAQWTGNFRELSASVTRMATLAFGASRLNKATSNNAERLRKYLARFELEWQNIRS